MLGLQRLDFHLPKFHHAPILRDAFVVFKPQAMLKRDQLAAKEPYSESDFCGPPSDSASSPLLIR